MRINKNLRVLVILSLVFSVTFSSATYLSNSSSIIHSYSSQNGQGHAITGSRNGGALGVHFDGVGDVNGDGIDDFIVGEPWGSRGTMYLFYGRLDPSWDELTTADAQASFVGGLGDNDWAGRWTAGLGDIDGNGYADFALSAIFDNDIGFREGKVHVFLGGSDVSWTIGMTVSQADVTIIGEANDDSIGHGVYGIGDTNNDGYDDFLVSSFSDEGGIDAGQLYLFLGRPPSQWLSTYSAADANASWIGAPGELLSLDASGIGDINSDGFSDFAVGAWTQSGTVSHRSVYVILGNDMNNWSMDQPITASNASFIGRNDTGLSDMEWSLDWISGAGDVNGDGFDDLVIGAYEEDMGGTNSGSTYLFYGGPTGKWVHNMTFSMANASFVGVSNNDWSGSSVSIVGDVNGDSFTDFVIGAPTPFDLTGAAGSGHAYLVLGSSSGTWGMNTSLAQANYTYEPEMTKDGFGFHVQGVGDVNNDSLDDFAIGAPYFDTSQINVGKTYTILHHDQTSTWTIASTTSTTSTSAPTSTTTTPPTTPTTAPPPFDTTIIFMAAIAVGIVAVVAVVYLVMRRR